MGKIITAQGRPGMPVPSEGFETPVETLGVTPEVAPIQETEVPVQQPSVATAPAVGTGPLVEAGVLEGIAAEAERAAAIETQQEAEALPGIKENLAAPGGPSNIYKYKADSKRSATEGNNGLFVRARALRDAFDSGAVGVGLYQDPRVLSGEPDVQARPLVAALDLLTGTNETGPWSAIETTQSVLDPSKVDKKLSPTFLTVASATIENTLSDYLQGIPETQDVVLKAAGEPVTEPEMALVTQVPAAKVAERVGKAISREYQRNNNATVSADLTSEQATALGAAMLSNYVKVNPDLIRESEDVVSAGDAKKPKVYQLTPEGAIVFKQADALRKKAFGKNLVSPLKTKPVNGKLVGEFKTLVRSPVKRVNTRLIDQGMRNQSTVGHVVDRTRSRVALATLLPALLSQPGSGQPVVDLFANMHNIGPKKMSTLIAQEKAALAENPEQTEYSANVVLESIKTSTAQHLFGIAKERKGINYLTYYMQGFNGRTAPQQSLFDPSSSKLVRFVTRGAQPAVAKRGNRVHRNLEQMYALHLVDGGSEALPSERPAMLLRATPQLLSWGKRLQALLDEAISPEKANEIYQAIEDGVSLLDPNFPKFSGLALDPEIDGALIAAIAKAGEDGPLYIDGLLDFVKFHKAVIVDNNPAGHSSYFNAYIDGKTNGLAAWGMLMGSNPMAFMTGVLRSQDKVLLDKGDIRDQLAETLADVIDVDGIAGSESLLGDSAPHVYTVARAVFNNRALNKYTTMTFGYGRDIKSFVSDISDAMFRVNEEAALMSQEELESNNLVGYQEAFAALQSVTDNKSLSALLLPTYTTGLHEVLSNEAIQTRSILKGVAANAALADVPFTMTTATGMEISLGGSVSGKVGEVKWTEFTQGERSQRSIERYGSLRRSAAAAELVNGKPLIGVKTMNRSVVASVQSIDAATVALTFTGKTWRRLTDASRGDPYLYQIYDAFKMDANGYDVVLNDVNENWVNATMDWDFMQEIIDTNKRAELAFEETLKGLSPDSVVNVGLNEVHQMMGSLTSLEVDAYGNATPVALKRHLENVDVLNVEQSLANIQKGMRDVGYKFSTNPTQATVKQVRHFHKLLNKEMALNQRLTQLRNKVNHNKKELRADIKAAGDSVYQYYMH